MLVSVLLEPRDQFSMHCVAQCRLFSHNYLSIASVPGYSITFSVFQYSLLYFGIDYRHCGRVTMVRTKADASCGRVSVAKAPRKVTSSGGASGASPAGKAAGKDKSVTLILNVYI